MAAKLLSFIRQRVRQILRDEFEDGATQEWDDDELNEHILTCVDEISEASPVKAWAPVLTTANSKLLDLSGIDGLIKASHAEYEPGQDPRTLLNINEIDSETVEMEGDAATESGTSGTLTGTVTFTAASATVTGALTIFSTELAAGDYIKPSGGDRWYRIYSIESATSLTLDEAVKSGDGGADTVSLTMYRSGVAIIYYDKAHTLTETRSTLKPAEENALLMGASAYAAISRAKSLINSINYGGGGTPAEMQNWGNNRLMLYREKLGRMKKPVTKRTY